MFCFYLQGFPDSILNCRACDSAQTVHPECWPIPVPKNDPYFPAVNSTSGKPHCIAFTRSLPGQQRLGKVFTCGSSFRIRRRQHVARDTEWPFSPPPWSPTTRVFWNHIFIIQLLPFSFWCAFFSTKFLLLAVPEIRVQNPAWGKLVWTNFLN